MKLREWGNLAVAFMVMVPGFLLGGYLGGKAEAWLERHPGPCVLGDRAECEAYRGEGMPVAMIGAMVGGVGFVGLFMIVVRAPAMVTGEPCKHETALLWCKDGTWCPLCLGDNCPKCGGQGTWMVGEA